MGCGVFGLIGCIPLSLSLALPTFFNNNNNNNKGKLYPRPATGHDTQRVNYNADQQLDMLHYRKTVTQTSGWTCYSNGKLQPRLAAGHATLTVSCNIDQRLDMLL